MSGQAWFQSDLQFLAFSPLIFSLIKCINRPHFFKLLVYVLPGGRVIYQEIALSTPFCIHEPTDAHGWLALLPDSEGREYTTPSFLSYPESNFFLNSLSQAAASPGFELANDYSFIGIVFLTMEIVTKHNYKTILSSWVSVPGNCPLWRSTHRTLSSVFK